MPATAFKASLDTLPAELMRMIMDEMDLVSYVDYPNPPHAEWLPIRLSWDVGPDPAAHDGTEEKIRTLRALSQTCKSIQSVVLPFLWQNVQLDTVAELGRLRETLRVSPHLAYHIRTFCFIWNPAFIPNRYFDEDPTLLEQMFLDRRALWQSVANKHNRKIRVDSEGRRFFRLQGREIREPEENSGPDLNGEARLIKSSDQLIESIVEVVAQLLHLETFGWCTPVMRMPRGVFDALTRLNTLTSLHINMFSSRYGQPCLPYWILAENLKTLSFEGPCTVDEIEPEQEAAQLTSFELPAEPHDDDAGDLDLAAVLRTIVTAVQTGKLRCLDIGYVSDCGYAEANENLQTPFAIRSLLPLWMQIDAWGEQPTPGWSGAAESLRPLLAHASLWLHPADAYNDRQLTGQDVQALCVQYDAEHVPVREWSEQYKKDKRPVTRYFPWLLEDAELSQRVADAWNAVVRRGGADLVACRCERCNSHYGRNKAWSEEVESDVSDEEAGDGFDEDAGEASEEEVVETSDEEA